MPTKSTFYGVKKKEKRKKKVRKVYILIQTNELHEFSDQYGETASEEIIIGVYSSYKKAEKEKCKLEEEYEGYETGSFSVVPYDVK